MASIKLSIDEPCHENWNAMLPEDRGRFCLSCQKTVVDFTAMNNRQVFDYFKNYQGNTCGQFSNDQLNRELTKPKTHSIGRWKYFWQILLPAVFAFHKTDAQPKLRGKVAATQTCKVDTTNYTSISRGMVITRPITKPATQIQGEIVNNKKEPVPFATITSSDGKYDVADSTGHFKILLSDKAVLTISQVGYSERTFTIDSLQTNNISGLKIENGHTVVEITIELKQAEVKPADVVVVGYKSTEGLVGMLGSISITTKRTIFSDKKLLTSNNNVSQLKIFPNPIRPGQDFQITLNVKKTGNYLLKIADASGRMITEQKINVVNKTQTETINGNALQQTGIYFVTLTNPAEKKGNILSGRVVVQ